jgi:hypothetical protein
VFLRCNTISATENFGSRLTGRVAILLIPDLRNRTWHFREQQRREKRHCQGLTCCASAASSSSAWNVG